MLELYFRFRFFYVCVTICMSFCIYLPNFVQIGPSATVMTLYLFSRWRPRHRNSTSAFGIRDNTYLGRRKSTCVPNFGEISQSTAVILLLPVSKNKRPPCWNSTSDSDFFTFASPSACHFASVYQISSKSDHPQQTYDVISIFQNNAMASQFYFRFQFSCFRSSGKVEIYLHTKFR